MEIAITQRHALVCGATQGIGNAVAHELAFLGAEITLLGRNEEALKEVLHALPASAGVSHRYVVADMSRTEELAQVVAQQL